MRVMIKSAIVGVSLSVRHYFKQYTENPGKLQQQKETTSSVFCWYFLWLSNKNSPNLHIQSAKMIYNGQIISTDQ